MYTYVHRTYKASGRNANATTAPYNERRSTASRVPKWMTGNVWTPLAAAANTNERLLTLSAAATTHWHTNKGTRIYTKERNARLFSFHSPSSFDSVLSSSSQGRRPAGAIRCFLISKKPITANFIMTTKLTSFFFSFNDTATEIDRIRRLPLRTVARKIAPDTRLPLSGILITI